MVSLLPQFHLYESHKFNFNAMLHIYPTVKFHSFWTFSALKVNSFLCFVATTKLNKLDKVCTNDVHNKKQQVTFEN